ncbi:MAG: hypothetical protein PSV22_03590 [Pseudolabrys sp.]|nr:hypothetical protein [Pseudolabrys sp.]
MNAQTDQKPAGGTPGGGKNTVGDAKAPATQEAVKVLPVAKDRLAHAQEVSTRRRLVVEDLPQYEALLKGDLDAWKIIGPKVQSGDTIEVIDDGSTFFALLFARLVISTGAGGLAHIEVVELLRKQLGEASENPPASGVWTVVYRGPYAKWCLIRPNGTIARDRMLSRDEATVMLNQQTAGRRGGTEVHF